MLLEHKGMFYFVSFPSQDQGGTVNGLFHFMLVEGCRGPAGQVNIVLLMNSSQTRYSTLQID